jgi:hypothetical protein
MSLAGRGTDEEFVQNISSKNLKGRDHFGGTRRGWYGNTKMDLKGIVWEPLD